MTLTTKELLSYFSNVDHMCTKGYSDNERSGRPKSNFWGNFILLIHLIFNLIGSIILLERINLIRSSYFN